MGGCPCERDGDQGGAVPEVVGIVMGSSSDLEVMSEAAKVLARFNVDYEIRVLSAHRRPNETLEYGKTARERGLRVLIAGAGGAAHLPGVLAAVTTLPVIGVPVALARLDGLDSLLSIVQMPRGIPVATVAINGAANAGLLALRILGSSNESLARDLESYRQELAEESKAQDTDLPRN
jgi:5-(carboxyamino)imidazole ribonucleotide mutase